MTCILAVLLVQACGSDSAPVAGADSLNGQRLGPGGCRLLSGRNTVTVGNVAVEVWVPEGEARADLLLLPGWNFPRTGWCENTMLCRKALHDGYRLIMPEMGKSIYATRYYPETRADWRVFPTSTWVVDTLIPTLQKEHCLLMPGAKNYVLGLSTGGRGVAMLGILEPELFKAGAALSGDFDQTLIPGDNLMRGVYGEMSDFPDRWKGEDNPALRAAEIKMPLYLAHGKKDALVPWQQTEHFFMLMRKAHPEMQMVLNLPEESGHDYAFWGNEVDAALAFFENAGHAPAGGM